MILPYFLAPWLLPARLALSVPGLLMGLSDARTRWGSALLFLLYLGLSVATPYAYWAESALSLGILWLWAGSEDPTILPLPLLLLAAAELVPLFFTTKFLPMALPRAASGLFETLLFVFSEELFLRTYLRPRLPAGFSGALLTGILWGLWHAPFHLSGYYIVVQVLRASALSLWIDAFYEKGGLSTAVALHALHNALLVPFDGAGIHLTDHILFFCLLAGMYLFCNRRYGQRVLPPVS